MHGRRRAAAVVLAVAASVTAMASRAQRFDAKRPKTITVGPARGASTEARVDGRRTGLARAPLPTGRLRVMWQRSVGVAVAGSPLVSDAGDVIVITARGEAVTLDHDDGSERAPTSPATGAPLGGPALLADGTVVFATAAGEAVGARGGTLRFRVHLGAAQPYVTVFAPERIRVGGEPAGWNDRGGAIALDDGGAAIAAGPELVAIDAEGYVRARAALDEPIGAPLVAVPALGKLAAITASGKTYLWAPGRDPVRVGSFGAPIDGAAALVDDRTLAAVGGPSQLLELDLTRGVAVARATSSALLLGPPAFRGDIAFLLAAAPGRVFALSIDGAGQELSRVGVATTALFADAGAGPAAPPSHTGPLVDAAGTLVFGTPDGQVGVLSKDGELDVLGEPLCTRTAGLVAGRPSPPPGAAAYAGLAPAGPNAFIVACETGIVAKVGPR